MGMIQLYRFTLMISYIVSLYTIICVVMLAGNYVHYLNYNEYSVHGGIYFVFEVFILYL